MPIDFIFDRLRIERFRGIEELDLPLPPRTPTYLIGGNNTGKSTLLNAFALALRGGGFYSFEVSEFDFYRGSDGSPADDFAVEIHFKASSSELLPAVQGVGNPIPVHGVRALGRRRKIGLEHRHVLFNEEGDAITISPRLPLKGAAKDKFKDHGLGWASYYARLDEIRQWLPEVWLLRPDNLERSLYHWQTGPLQRLAALMSEQFLSTKWQLDFGGQARAMPATMEKAHAFLQAAVQQFPFWKDRLKPELENALSQYLGRAAVIGLQPDIQAFKDWLAQQLAASFAAEAGAPMTPLSAMGHGWQALVRLAALEVLQGLKESETPVLILFEEPETYLHPHLRRKLRDVLDRLASRGWIVVCSTHAPEFISFSRNQQVVRLWRSSGSTASGRLLSSDVLDGVKFDEKLWERGQHEFLFSNRVVLCEGKDDCFAVKTLLEKSGVDLDGQGVTVLDLGGIQNLPAYARIAKELHIPWCGLTDEDYESPESKTAATQIRGELAELSSAADICPIWPGNLERSLKISRGSASPRWQEKNLSPKGLEHIGTDYPDFAKVGDAIAAWATKR